MRTFSELKNDVATLVQRSNDTSYKTDIGVWLNLTNEFLFNSYDYFTELQGIHNFTTANGTEDYMMPNNFDKPFRVYDLTNDKDLDPNTEEEYFDANIANIGDSTKEKSPSIYRIYGVQGTSTAIGSSGTTLKVKSSDSSDTSITVRIEGYIDSALTIIDFEDIVTNSTNGTTAVAGSKTFYKVTHIGKSADTTGYITITDSSNNTLAIMASFERVLHHKVMKLGLIPNQANSMRVLYKKKINKLVNDNDYPFVDADDFYILNAWGYALSQEKETMERAITIWQKAEQSLVNFMKNVVGKFGPDFQHKLVSSLAQAHRA